MKRTEYATLNRLANVASNGSANCKPFELPAVSDSSKNISFDRKPFSSGTPAMAPAATSASSVVIGIARRRPFSRLRSRVPVS